MGFPEGSSRLLRGLSSPTENCPSAGDALGAGRSSHHIREPAPQIPGWSADWTAFTRSHEWVDPIPLQLSAFALGSYKESPPVVAIRQRLHKYGAIVLIMYDAEDHSHVVFRTGERLLICRTHPTYDDEVTTDNSEFDLGVIPRTYSQFLALNTDTISALLSDPEVNTSLNMWRTGEVVRCRANLAWLFTEARKYLNLEGKEKQRADEILATWSDEQWDSFSEMAYEIAYLRSENVSE